MGLKLTLQSGDKVMLSNGVMIDVNTTSNKQTQLEFHADASVKINTVFKDSSKMFKNRRKESSFVDDIEADGEKNFNR